MSAIGGRGGVSAKMPQVSVSDDSDDPNDPFADVDGGGTAVVGDMTAGADTGLSALADNGAALPTQTTLDTEVAAKAQQAGDERQDATSARTAKKTVGGRGNGIPQAVGADAPDDKESLSAAAIALQVGRVRI